MLSGAGKKWQNDSGQNDSGQNDGGKTMGGKTIAGCRAPICEMMEVWCQWAMPERPIDGGPSVGWAGPIRVHSVSPIFLPSKFSYLSICHLEGNVE
ncbi:hypothetical protein Mal15_50150 [Stieleria maiorica]|uniref:Uncharacterized protein n=1 Tax=Stieleria maiorica TaxID=2795974 RepID=A0A5B9MID0_9BACT|nr:hypothetical protein Mal15_50150 [Stieleria maiorica]